MIDWTDRSEDVLARFEACRTWQSQCTLVERKSKEMAEWQLMQDLATMVRLLSLDMAKTEAILVHNECPASRLLELDAKGMRIDIMSGATDAETGERLFPDPRS